FSFPLLLRRNRLWRVSYHSLASFCFDELVDCPLLPSFPTRRSSDLHRVVVRRLWLEALDAHAERRVLMALVQPDGIFRRLAQILGVGTVAHDAVMHVRPPGVVDRPPDDRQVIRGQFELWPSGDLDALGLLGRRK